MNFVKIQKNIYVLYFDILLHDGPLERERELTVIHFEPASEFTHDFLNEIHILLKLVVT